MPSYYDFHPGNAFFDKELKETVFVDWDTAEMGKPVC
jgi:aminoglycoside phosphotransferase (APT) family kinase protein